MTQGTVALDFGSDILCLIRFISRIKDNKDNKDNKDIQLRRIFATVIGRDLRNECDRTIENPLTGRITNCELKGYIRSIEIKSEDGVEWDIGGSNATAEHFAAKNISIDLPMEYFIRFHEAYLPYYRRYNDEDASVAGISIDALEYSSKNGTYDVAMALARRLPLKISFDYLVSCLQEPHHKDRMEFVCEGFRSLVEIYSESEDIAKKGFQELREFIERYASDGMEHEYNTAIVYAAEALGYIARASSSPENSEAISRYLIDLAIQEHEIGIHDHLFWCIICSIDHSQSFKERKNLHKLKAILSNKRENISEGNNRELPWLDVPEVKIAEAIKASSSTTLHDSSQFEG